MPTLFGLPPENFSRSIHVALLFLYKVIVIAIHCPVYIVFDTLCRFDDLLLQYNTSTQP